MHPQNPDVVLACALGHAYGPQPERGVFRTTDGGKTWDRVLFVDENTGCSELAMDPTNPRKLFAGMWQFDIKTWGRESGGPGQRTVHVERRRRRRGRGSRATACRRATVGKVKVAIAPSNPDRVYAMIETGDGIPWNGKRPIAARCGGPTTAATSGAWSATTATPWAARTTTRTSSWRPTTRTKPIS